MSDKQKIKFITTSMPANNIDDAPVPSLSVLPNWYKDLAPYNDASSTNIKHLFPINDRGSDGTDVSTKLCMPFLDSMVSGYMIVLQEDVTVEIKDKDKPKISWESKNTTVDIRPNVDMPIPAECYPIQFGWRMNWYYETPPGYSLLFTHPLNRYDLPFYGASGIVDCDIWGLPVFMPFFLKKEFNGIIKKGTPIYQVIPIKRDEWEMEIDTSEESFWKHKEKEEKRRSHVTAHYRKTTWQKKKYK
jgi:hypothetical protein